MVVRKIFHYLISTDKVYVNPTNVMGAFKTTLPRVLLERMQTFNGGSTTFNNVRLAMLPWESTGKWLIPQNLKSQIRRHR